MVRGIGDNRKGIFWFLITSILITVAFRWPTTYHETGVDSFFIHSLANSVTQFGDLRWVANPLSLFGLYPLSYASGIPILLAEFSNMTGLTMEETVLIFSFLTAIIAALSAFLLGLEIRNSAPFAFAISVLFSACPILLFSTEWTTGTRAMFTAILPFALWTLIRLGKIEYKELHIRKRRELLFIFVITLFLMAIIHNLFFMMIVFIIAYFIVKRLLYFQSPLREYFISIKGRKQFLSKYTTLLPIAIIIALTIVVANYTGWLNFESFEVGFFKGNSSLDSFLNLITPIAATLGFPIIFLLPISIIIVLKSKKKDFTNLFFLVSILFVLPFSGGRTYEKWIYPIVLCLLILSPIYLIVSSKNRRRYAKVAIVAILLTLPLNLLIVEHSNRWPESLAINDGISTSDHVYMTALYYGNCFNGEYFTSNNEFSYGGVQAYTNCPQMSTGEINLILFRIIDNEEMNAELNDIEEFLSKKGSLYSAHLEKSMYEDYGTLLFSRDGPATANDLLSRYDIHTFIEDGRIDGKMVGYAGKTLYPIGDNSLPFIDGVHEATYKIYDNGIDIIWIVR